MGVVNEVREVRKTGGHLELISSVKTALITL